MQKDVNFLHLNSDNSDNGGVCVVERKDRIFLYQMKALVEKLTGLKY
jgi:hypothetical protein